MEITTSYHEKGREEGITVPVSRILWLKRPSDQHKRLVHAGDELSPSMPSVM